MYKITLYGQVEVYPDEVTEPSLVETSWEPQAVIQGDAVIVAAAARALADKLDPPKKPTP
jgi:hypothetical protein